MSQVCRNFQRGSCSYGANCRFTHTAANANNLTRKGHICDGTSCKEMIVKDRRENWPVYWRATSYSHADKAGMDIVGDVTFEEAQWEAIQLMGQGVSLNELVEREKRYFNERLTHFNRLRDQPYRLNSDRTAETQSPYPSIYAATPSNVQAPPGTTMIFGRIFANPSSSSPPADQSSASVGTSGSNVGIQQSLPFSSPQPQFQAASVITPSNDFGFAGQNAQQGFSAFPIASNTFPSPSAPQTPFLPSSSQQANPSGAVDDIWMVESWSLGRIPEVEPPPYAR